jgi:hypothetical protein
MHRACAPGFRVSKHRRPPAVSLSYHNASTLAYVLFGIAVIQDQEMEFSRPMHADSELQLDVSRAAGASHKRHTARQILLRVGSGRLR